MLHANFLVAFYVFGFYWSVLCKLHDIHVAAEQCFSLSFFYLRLTIVKRYCSAANAHLYMYVHFVKPKKISPYDEYRSSGPRPIKLCSDH